MWNITQRNITQEKKRNKYLIHTTWVKFKDITLNGRHKEYILYDFVPIKFLAKSNCRDRKQVYGCQRLRMGMETDYKMSQRNFDKNVLKFDCVDDCTIDIEMYT